MKPPRSQAKWYGCHSQQKSDTTETVASWSTNSSKLYSGYLRIGRQAGITTSPPQSRPISQDTLRKWEKFARESSVICNQAVGFNRCLMKVQQDMQSQLKAIRVEHKGKSSSKLSTATEELQFFMDFNSSICQAMAKSMEHLTDFVFVNMANVTLLRSSGWTIRPMFDQSSVLWYNRVWSLTTPENRLNLTLLYVSQYPCIFYILSSFLHFNLINLWVSHEFCVCLQLPPYLPEVGAFGRF